MSDEELAALLLKIEKRRQEHFEMLKNAIDTLQEAQCGRWGF
jgi:hypothetical protein